MTVKDLMDRLSKVNPNLPIYAINTSSGVSYDVSGGWEAVNSRVFDGTLMEKEVGKIFIALHLD